MFLPAIVSIFFLASLLSAADFVEQEIDGADKMQSFYNPDRGFYTPQVIHFKPTAAEYFSYDPWYNGGWKYEKGFEMEPGQKWILRHIRQLAKVYDEYDDVITAVELGMYGPYGENHTSALSGAKMRARLCGN